MERYHTVIEIENDEIRDFFDGFEGLAEYISDETGLAVDDFINELEESGDSFIKRDNLGIRVTVSCEFFED